MAQSTSTNLANLGACGRLAGASVDTVGKEAFGSSVRACEFVFVLDGQSFFDAPA